MAACAFKRARSEIGVRSSAVGLAVRPSGFETSLREDAGFAAISPGLQTLQPNVARIKFPEHHNPWRGGMLVDFGPNAVV